MARPDNGIVRNVKAAARKNVQVQILIASQQHKDIEDVPTSMVTFKSAFKVKAAVRNF